MSDRTTGDEDLRNENDESTSDERDGSWPISRRDFLAFGATAAAVGLGTSPAHGASVVDETCSNYGSLTVGDGDFEAINNMWSTTDVTQCTRLYDDGSYGWSWDRGGTGVADPNFPQALCGTKPWGRDTGAGQFPLKRRDVDQLELALDVDVSVSGGEWNLTEEWWLTTDEPGGGTDVSDSITHEVMTVFEWGSDHTHGPPAESNIGTDAYGNTFDYWQYYDIGWDFHIFRIQGNAVPANVDFSPVMEYVSSEFGVGGDAWVSGIEVGNEYWDYTDGSTRFYEFDVVVNGTSSVSGANASSGDSTAPTAPSNLVAPSTSDTSVDLDWDAASDRDTGVEAYKVYVDGAQDHEVMDGTSSSVQGLSTGTSYDFHVTAEDGAGNESAASNTVTATPGGTPQTETETETESTDSGGSDGGSSGGLTLNDYDGSPSWPGTNDLGGWADAGSFDAAGVENGALRLASSGGGWLGSGVGRDVSGYTHLKMRVRGDAGGEESYFAVEFGGTKDVVSNLTDDAIETSYSTVSIDMAANGMDRTSPEAVRLDFWSGSYGSAAIEIDRIWFE